MSATGFQKRRRDLEAQAEQAVENVTAQPPTVTGQTNTPAGNPSSGGDPAKSLADMTVKELRAMADAKSITLGRELTKKADIVSAMEKALGES